MIRRSVAALLGAALLFVSSSANAGLLDRMIYGGGCCGVEPSCCAPVEPACCAPEPSCCEADACCGHRGGWLRRVFERCCNACAPSCCEPICAEPACCAPVVEPSCCAPEPTCCEPAACCDNGCAPRCGLLHRLFHRGCGSCCEPSCCEPSCAAPCGCGY